MKLSTIMIIIQAIIMLAAVAATAFMMYQVKGTPGGKTGAEIFDANSLIFYIAIGLHGVGLVVHGLSTFWCKGR